MSSPHRAVPSDLLPILGEAPANAPLLFRHSSAMTRGAFLAAALRLAETLPERRWVANYCMRRDHFIVALVAAMLRGQVTLLPNDTTRRSLELLAEEHDGLYCLGDATAGPEGFPFHRVTLADTAFSTMPPVPAIPADRIVVKPFTSGTTGRPVAQAKHWGSLVGAAQLTVERFGLDGRWSVVATVPPQHMYGLETSVMLPLQSAVGVEATRPLYPVDIAEALERVPEPRLLVTAPVHLRAIVADRLKLPRVERVISATAPLSQTLAAAAEETLGAEVLEIYGSTETGSIASRRTVAGAEWRPFDGVRLVTEEDGCRVIASHLPDISPLQDVIETGADGSFFLRGRKSDMVNIAGKRASLAGLNAILLEIAGVEDGAFLLPDGAEDGAVTRLLAFVVAPRRTAEELKTELRRRLDPAFVPRRIHLVEALPRNPLGKLPHAALAALAASLADKR